MASHRRTLQAQRSRLLVAETAWSWARLVTFGAAASVWYPFGDQTILALAAVALLCGVFAYSVRRHRFARGQRELVDRVLQMVQESRQRCGGRVVLIRAGERPNDAADPALVLSPVLDDGARWLLTKQERDDLDLYASPVSLFGLLNRCSTSFGSRRLRDLLEHPCVAIDHLRDRQEAVRWLENNPAQRWRIMGATAGLRSHDTLLEKLTAAVRTATPLPWPIWCTVLRAWSLVAAAITLVAVIRSGQGHAGWGFVAVGLFAVNGSIYVRLRRTLNARIAPWRTVTTAVGGCFDAARQAATDLPNETELGRLRDCLTRVVAPAVLPALRRRVAWSDSGGVFHAASNLFFFYDLHVAGSILNCVVPNRDTLLTGLSALADLEALISLACFAFESGTADGVCYPTLSTEPVLTIEAGRHPLMPPETTTPNDVHLSPTTRMWVITGSNMAGKSTLLRMCAVNCLLAQAGTVATAQRMSLSPLRLITDLQVRDDLADGESYFLAEVRHLRRLVEPEFDGGLVLGLMDEPFRGTNSTERVAAALALVEHLLDSPNFFLVATHEQELTELASRRDAAENRHFRENLGADGLVFDYHLQPGPATTRNALRVMERERYPPELLTRAHEWVQVAASRGRS